MGSVASIHVHDDAPVELIDVVIAEVLAELEKYDLLFYSSFAP